MKKLGIGAFILALFGIAVMLPSSASADVITTRGSIYGKLGPEAYAGSTTYSSTYNMTSSHNGVTAGDTEVMFNNRGSLRAGVCVPDDTRKMTVTLMEDDWTNSDDVVKNYVWSFDDLDMTTVMIPSYNSSQLIDASDDNGVELYLAQHLDYRAGDATTTNGPMYYFDLTVY